MIFLSSRPRPTLARPPTPLATYDFNYPALRISWQLQCLSSDYGLQLSCSPTSAVRDSGCAGVGGGGGEIFCRSLTWVPHSPCLRLTLPFPCHLPLASPALKGSSHKTLPSICCDATPTTPIRTSPPCCCRCDEVHCRPSSPSSRWCSSYASFWERKRGVPQPTVWRWRWRRSVTVTGGGGHGVRGCFGRRPDDPSCVKASLCWLSCLESQSVLIQREGARPQQHRITGEMLQLYS